MTASRSDLRIDRDTLRLVEGKQRYFAVLHFNRLIASGVSKNRATKAVRAPTTSLWRWRGAHSKFGLQGLFDNRVSNGRQSFRDRFGIDDSILAEVRRIATQDRVDLQTAWETFALSARCHRSLARVILRGKPPLPKKLLRLNIVEQPQPVAA